MIKLETHCHLKGGSGCAHAPIDVGINEYKRDGYDGVVLTNHIHPLFYNRDYPGNTHKEKMDYWFSLADKFIELGRKAGIKTFIGAEIYARLEDGRYTEFMIYGFDRKFLYDNKPLFELTQKELFALAEKNRLFMYQTHPCREFVITSDPKYLHGAEKFNGHILHKNNNEQAIRFCTENNLKCMSGTDYHDEGQTIIGGIYIPDNINDEFALADYLLNNQPKIIEEEERYRKFYKGTL